jgi:hypothetical protein
MNALRRYGCFTIQPPMLPPMIFFVTLAFAFFLTLLLTPLAGELGRRWGLVDAPGGRRKHTGIIPRTGGLALFGGFFVTVLLITVLPDWLAGGRGLVSGAQRPQRGTSPGRTAGRLALLRRLWPARRPLQLQAGPQYLIQFGAA